MSHELACLAISITGDFIGPNGAFRYMLSNESTSWNVAANRCVAWGGELASLKDPTLVQYVNKAITVDKYWIGGSDREKEGEWKWMDGSKIEKIKWGDRQPNGGSSANCLLVIEDGWNDKICSKRQRFLCQFKATKICGIRK